MRQVVLDTETTGLEVDSNTASSRSLRRAGESPAHRALVPPYLNRSATSTRVPRSARFEREQLAKEPKFADIHAELLNSCATRSSSSTMLPSTWRS